MAMQCARGWGGKRFGYWFACDVSSVSICKLQTQYFLASPRNRWNLPSLLKNGTIRLAVSSSPYVIPVTIVFFVRCSAIHQADPVSLGNGSAMAAIASAPLEHD